jgi:hypothetical protein
MNDMATGMPHTPEEITAVTNCTNDVLFLMEKWKDLHQESDEARWQRFYLEYLTQEVNPNGKGRTEDVKASTNLTEGEMRVNCYALAKTLGEGLLKCGRCMMIKYCSASVKKSTGRKRTGSSAKN